MRALDRTRVDYLPDCESNNNVISCRQPLELGGVGITRCSVALCFSFAEVKVHGVQPSAHNTIPMKSLLAETKPGAPGNRNEAEQIALGVAKRIFARQT